MSMFSNNALLWGGVRFRAWIREQRKIKRRSEALLCLWWQTWTSLEYFLTTESGEGGHFWQLKLVRGTPFGPHQFLRDRPMYVGTQMDKWRAEEPVGQLKSITNKCMGWINATHKCKLKIAVMQFYPSLVVLGLCVKLSYARVLPKKFWVFSSNEGVPCGFCHTALQSFKCVCGAWTYVCIHKAHFLSSPRSAVTAVLSSLHSGVVVHS